MGAILKTMKKISLSQGSQATGATVPRAGSVRNGGTGAGGPSGKMQNAGGGGFGRASGIQKGSGGNKGC